MLPPAREHRVHLPREHPPRGHQPLPARVRSVIAVLQVQWPGAAYDLLARNCNHFCQAFAEMIGVGPAPAWVNRFAHQADATVNAVTYARDQTRAVVEEISLAATAATHWLISGFAATEHRGAETAETAEGGEGSDATNATGTGTNATGTGTNATGTETNATGTGTNAGDGVPIRRRYPRVARC